MSKYAEFVHKHEKKKKKETSCRLLEPRNLINAPISLNQDKRDSTAQGTHARSEKKSEF
jgi:hypothetical protein